MGEVYKVLDRSTQLVYALKMISPYLADQKTLAKRLEHEAQAARTLAHGNIVSVYDVGNTTDGAPFLIMDYVEGISLDQLLRDETFLSSNRALTIFLQIADALVHAQQKSIVHRDLKPSNILLTKTAGDIDIVKIVDFGIAKISNQENVDKTKLTQTGDLLGTPLYMSPEQCIGEEIDARSDIYSFGCIMYEMLTGKPPFAADNPVKIILSHLNEKPPPLPVGAGISAGMKQVVMRCLEKHRSDRYSNAAELHVDLERVLDGRPIKAHVPKRKQKQKLLLIGGVCCILLAGALGFGLMANQHQSPNLIESGRPLIPDTYRGKTLAQWTSLIEQSPDDLNLYMDRAQLHSMRDERMNAIDDYTHVIDSNPMAVDALAQRAALYVMVAQYQNAGADAKKLASLAPNASKTYETLGWIASATEQFPAAAKEWKHADSLTRNGYYDYQRATALLKLGRFDEAQSTIQNAIHYDDEPMYRGIAGLIATFKQDFSTAERELSAATHDPRTRGVEWHELAHYYLSIGKFNEAEQAMKKGVAMETFPARAHRFAGEFYRTAGQFDKAIQEFNMSTSLEEYPPGYRERAVCYIQLGQWRAAFNDLKKSLELNPFSATTRSYLAMVLNHLKDNAAASKHIAKAFAPPEVPPIVYVNRATIRLNDGDLKGAMDDANSALSKDPWLKEGYEVRASVHEKMNAGNDARLDREKAAKLTSHLDY